jgi:hypothetical protein
MSINLKTLSTFIKANSLVDSYNHVKSLEATGEQSDLLFLVSHYLLKAINNPNLESAMRNRCLSLIKLYAL